MPLKALIVDDELLARSRMRTLLEQCTNPQVSVVGEAANAAQAMDLLDERVMLNRAAMSKFGVRLGDVTLSFFKRKA